MLTSPNPLRRNSPAEQFLNRAPHKKEGNMAQNTRSSRTRLAPVTGLVMIGTFLIWVAVPMTAHADRQADCVAACTAPNCEAACAELVGGADLATAKLRCRGNAGCKSQLVAFAGTAEDEADDKSDKTRRTKGNAEDTGDEADDKSNKTRRTKGNAEDTGDEEEGPRKPSNNSCGNNAHQMMGGKNDNEPQFYDVGRFRGQPICECDEHFAEGRDGECVLAVMFIKGVPHVFNMWTDEYVPFDPPLQGWVKAVLALGVLGVLAFVVFWLRGRPQPRDEEERPAIQQVAIAPTCPACRQALVAGVAHQCPPPFLTPLAAPVWTPPAPPPVRAPLAQVAAAAPAWRPLAPAPPLPVAVAAAPTPVVAAVAYPQSVACKTCSTVSTVSGPGAFTCGKCGAMLS